MIIAGNRLIMIDTASYAVLVKDKQIIADGQGFTESFARNRYSLASYDTRERAEEVFLDMVEAVEDGEEFFQMPMK